MPTYVYETIPSAADECPVRFEIEQRMSAAALTVHPKTGVPVRRVVSGGLGFLGVSDKGGTSAPATGVTCPHSGQRCGCH